MFFRFGRQEARILFKAALMFSVVREQRANDRKASQRNGKRKRYHPQQWIAHQYGGRLIDGVTSSTITFMPRFIAAFCVLRRVRRLLVKQLRSAVKASKSQTKPSKSISC